MSDRTASLAQLIGAMLFLATLQGSAFLFLTNADQNISEHATEQRVRLWDRMGVQEREFSRISQDLARLEGKADAILQSVNQKGK